MSHWWGRIRQAIRCRFGGCGGRDPLHDALLDDIRDLSNRLDRYIARTRGANPIEREVWPEGDRRRE